MDKVKKRISKLLEQLLTRFFHGYVEIPKISNNILACPFNDSQVKLNRIRRIGHAYNY